MERVPIWVFPILIILIFPKASSEEEGVKRALIQFMDKLSPGNARTNSWGWNIDSDPCKDKWMGVICDKKSNYVRKIALETLNLSGVLDAKSLCMAKSLMVLSLKDNNITGLMPEDIESCKSLTHLYLSGNQFTGDLPESLSRLNNLKRLDISNNNFYGELPDLQLISGLISFLAENNQLRGQIPKFDFLNLMLFNVSNNNFSGPIPDVKGRFSAESFLGNPNLCGKPLNNSCLPTPSPPPAMKKSRSPSSGQILIYLGYVILGLVVLLFIVFKLVVKKKKPKQNSEAEKKKILALENSTAMPSTISSYELKNDGQRSEYSLTSIESGKAPALTVLTSPVRGLTFEELLQAPAELLGRGKHGSLYKVMLGNGAMLAVKRIKDWWISREDFKWRMTRIDQVKHLNVLQPFAYYCSKQEKLLVYEYQQNGSLFQLLHGSQSGQVFDWGSRLTVAATVAQGISYMHEELNEDGLAHGNLKSMNILFNKTMDPCISEYGLMAVENQDQSLLSPLNSIKTEDLEGDQAFKVDIYGFGVILLELLTGKLVQVNGFDLPGWVQSVVREEWTFEVFDKALISEGASEERMVNLLHIALKCTNPSPNERPAMSQVSQMINAIKAEEEKSISFDP
ncbi:probable inactive receptor kinase At2g26730 [Ziziphus jujuba]|uniref:Probable inactive receptor kinase At2g26730 n=1 Tax=Ziziphus jujuba TaxID=326968 RepID=A0A6P3ZS62_ZIZJJ|nr:probable inactive receptor kinase At2g26730 [Ziziphus jujuba]